MNEKDCEILKKQRVKVKRIVKGERKMKNAYSKIKNFSLGQ